jgi:hypothetical protein
MTRPDIKSLAPSDAEVALRSFPRRYREALAPEAGENLESIIEWVGPMAVSVLDLVVDATRTVVFLDRALHLVLTQDKPVLHEAVIRPVVRDWHDGLPRDLEETLRELDSACPAFADRVHATKGKEWNREGAIAGGGSTTALEIVREAVRTAADNLRQIGPLREAFRR